MEFRKGEDAFFYFPVIDEQTNQAIDIEDAIAVWVCGKTVNYVFTPEQIYHSDDQANPIIPTTDPDDVSQNPPINTFRVLLTHDDSAKLLGVYDYEIAMVLGDYRIIIYPPIDTAAQFTVKDSLTWDSEQGKSRIIRHLSPITLPTPEEPKPEPPKRRKID